MVGAFPATCGYVGCLGSTDKSHAEIDDSAVDCLFYLHVVKYAYGLVLG